ncbi:MAG: N-formylglutamate amidohydrolase [Deltaproteobacteria bacterium]|nr:N-formylglutamate amidohydrolase [Deltaproteobacteria bacterium]
MTALPVLLSIPHGGMDVPEEIRDRVAIDAHDVHDDIDPFVRELYDLGPKVLHVVSTSTARTFVDLNRARDDRPPKNPDGVVKTLTCVGKTIFAPGRELDAPVTETLLERYYEPYHRRLGSAVQSAGARLALDCHSMQAVGPVISPDAGRPRPVFCLGNARGDACSDEVTQRLADCLRRAFDLREDDVTLNEPFSGGYITRAYGGRPLPWIQVEMNRSLYLASPWFERATLAMDPRRLAEIRGRFESALRRFFDSSGKTE